MKQKTIKDYKQKIPAWQQAEVERRLEQVANREMPMKSWEEAKEEIFKQ